MFSKENFGGTIILPFACCSINGCPECPNKPGASSHLRNQTATQKEKTVGSGGGSS